jgi:flagellar basal-body rod modification protein FlgD
MELNQILSKDEFLKMFLAQIKNQNPLEPMEGLDFTNQLAQFSTLEQLQNANTKIDTLISQETENQNALAVSFIGKEVTTFGNGVAVTGNSDRYALKFSLADEASDVTVLIKDSKNNIVADLDQGAYPGGSTTCYWDGKDKNGNAVPPGNYSFMVSAKNLSGEPVEVSTYTTGLVTGVSFEDSSTYLVVNGNKVKLSDIQSINDQNNS